MKALVKNGHVGNFLYYFHQNHRVNFNDRKLVNKYPWVKGIQIKVDGHAPLHGEKIYFKKPRKYS